MECFEHSKWLFMVSFFCKTLYLRYFTRFWMRISAHIYRSDTFFCFPKTTLDLFLVKGLFKKIYPYIPNAKEFSNGHSKYKGWWNIVKTISLNQYNQRFIHKKNIGCPWCLIYIFHLSNTICLVLKRQSIFLLFKPFV